MKPFALALGMSVLLLGSASCSSEEEPGDKPQGDRCSLNSECVEPMVCGFERCRPQCATSRDCGGRRCMRSTATANVCQLDDESTCSHNSECPGSQICASDLQCRDACVTAKDCVSGQECIDSVCVEPAELQPDGTLTSRAPADGVACTYATECPGTLVCLDGVCAIECLEDKDCFVTWACFKESVGGDDLVIVAGRGRTNPWWCPVRSLLLDSCLPRRWGRARWLR
ncbi:MAG: hypothetical protein EOP08_13420 [Proteobacteria bacterium]|nr:MAG: hypothetical protein EOP08_13420 [Pseudomonadota bacterium]